MNQFQNINVHCLRALLALPRLLDVEGDAVAAAHAALLGVVALLQVLDVLGMREQVPVAAVA